MSERVIYSHSLRGAAMMAAYLAREYPGVPEKFITDAVADEFERYEAPTAAEKVRSEDEKNMRGVRSLIGSIFILIGAKIRGYPA
jgi:hypothetical protein